MHGLVNRALQRFLRDTYGATLWAEIATESGVNPDGFEAMLHYDDAITRNILASAARALDRSEETILEDVGNWLVASDPGQPLRRLLRFGGVTFTYFLNSLEELPGRGRLAIHDLGLPSLKLTEFGNGSYELHSQGAKGYASVLVGILRAMADDYGSLVMLDHLGSVGEEERIRINVIEDGFAEGRYFELAHGDRR